MYGFRVKDPMYVRKFIPHVANENLRKAEADLRKKVEELEAERRAALARKKLEREQKLLELEQKLKLKRRSVPPFTPLRTVPPKPPKTNEDCEDGYVCINGACYPSDDVPKTLNKKQPATQTKAIIETYKTLPELFGNFSRKQLGTKLPIDIFVKDADEETGWAHAIITEIFPSFVIIKDCSKGEFDGMEWRESISNLDSENYKLVKFYKKVIII